MSFFQLNKSPLLSFPFLNVTSYVKGVTACTLTSFSYIIFSKEQEQVAESITLKNSVIGFTCPSLKELK